MNVLVIGAPAPVLRRLRTIAAEVSSDLSIIDQDGPRVPDWVLTATSAQRTAAITAYTLLPYRVMEVGALLSESELQQSESAIRSGLKRIAEIGAPRPVISSIGTALTRVVVRRLHAATERAAAQGLATPADVRGEATAWPTGAAAWTTGPNSVLDAHVAPPVIVGPELDEKLQDIARKRARRFARHRVHWEPVEPAGSR